MRPTASLVHLSFTSLRCEHARRPLAAFDRARTRSTPGRHTISFDRLALFRGNSLCLPCCPAHRAIRLMQPRQPAARSAYRKDPLQVEYSFEFLDSLDIRINDHPIGMQVSVSSRSAHRTRLPYA